MVLRKGVEDPSPLRRVPSPGNPECVEGGTGPPVLLAGRHDLRSLTIDVSAVDDLSSLSELTFLRFSGTPLATSHPRLTEIAGMASPLAALREFYGMSGRRIRPAP